MAYSQGDRCICVRMRDLSGNGKCPHRLKDELIVFAAYSMERQVAGFLVPTRGGLHHKFAAANAEWVMLFFLTRKWIYLHCST